MLRIQDPRDDRDPELDPADLRRRLSRRMLRTVTSWKLVEEGDRILVGLSGGKDSYTLIDLLWAARRKAPVRFDLIGLHLDQGQPGHDSAPLARWLEEREIPHEIVREDTYSAMLAHSRATDQRTYCRVCSRLRRGILYTAAGRMGCNKVALGHHRDDALETLLLNLLYAGRLQAMPARYTTNDGQFVVVRPLVECPEDRIARHAAAAAYPILPCRLCGSQGDLKRERVSRLLAELESEIPGVRSVMMAALGNVRPSHLLDPEVAEAWESRAGSYPPRR